MNAELPAEVRATERGARAEALLRRCVHCGFCNATCPTYQLSGDERDGPRGRIYLVKAMLEAGAANATAARHLDRCLTCRACETTCPSGVQYGELAEIGRELIAEGPLGGTFRSRTAGLYRRWLLRTVPHPRRLRRWIRLGRCFRWLLPRSMRPLLEAPRGPQPRAAGAVVLLQGCAQRVLTPDVNAHLTRLLSRRGIASGPAALEECCGGLPLHFGDRAAACRHARRNVAAMAGQEADAIVSTASGCGVTWKDYGRLLGTEEARNVAAKVLDVAEFLQAFSFAKRLAAIKVAWHPPCTLQHGQRVAGLVEAILRRTGYQLTPVRDAHLCCGSAGVYSLLHPSTATALGRAKAEALLAGGPEVVATANVGCQTHLAGRVGGVPVKHWIELLD